MFKYCVLYISIDFLYSNPHPTLIYILIYIMYISIIIICGSRINIYIILVFYVYCPTAGQLCKIACCVPSRERK